MLISTPVTRPSWPPSGRKSTYPDVQFCQATSILSGLQGVGHVIADAAYDADPLRAFIANDLGATAQIKANPSRAGVPPIDWKLYKERHQVECFFNKLKRFRRIALRCEKTIAAFMGFVHLACAMIWIR
ncbi:transposase, IS4 family [Sphingobium sp. YR768]|nr:transposase, IS4 family [Sphingobium sp. YR768]